MAHQRRFRFGIKLRAAENAEAWLEQARRAESIGYDTAVLADHIGHPLSPLPAALAAALATTTLRIGTSVLCNDFRHPAILAKEVATIDWLSKGRFELGLGAGWMQEDHAMTGITRDPAATRIERLEESAQVIRALLTEGPVDFEGQHYRISGLEGRPSPIQPGGPPILIGGGGRMLLGVAGRNADIVGINPSVRSGNHDAETDLDASAASTDRKFEWLREAAGTRFDSIEFATETYLAMPCSDRAEADRLLEERFRQPAPEARAVPYGLVGTLDEICASLETRRERWLTSYWIFPPEAMEAMAPVVERLTGR